MADTIVLPHYSRCPACPHCKAANSESSQNSKIIRVVLIDLGLDFLVWNCANCGHRWFSNIAIKRIAPTLDQPEKTNEKLPPPLSVTPEPCADTPAQRNADDLLRDRCIMGFKSRFGHDESSPLSPPDRNLYRNQLKIELAFIADTNMAAHFLAAEKPTDTEGLDRFVTGSLVGYLLSKTDSDPILTGRCSLRPASPAVIERFGLDKVVWPESR